MMESVVLKKIYSQRGNVLILKDGFKFSKYGTLQTGESGWKCVEKSCRAKLYTVPSDDCRFSRETGEHNHSPLDENVILRQAISNRLKRKTVECLMEKPAKLVAKEVYSKQSAMEKLTVNDIKLIKDNMYHARAKRKQHISNSQSRVQSNTSSSTRLKNKNHQTARTKMSSSKQCEIAAGSSQDNSIEEWPEWMIVEPHFLATDVP